MNRDLSSAGPEDVAIPDADWRRGLRRALLSWYDRHARDLPWRRVNDPYQTWVSEVMLQQTQVATVKPYFERFMQRFPDIARLAAADETEVLRYWEGLGYYRRARQLHQAAQQLANSHAGRFPTEIEQVMALPGIGRYTAGAILSIAFDQPHPILEGNTMRVYSRLLGYRADPRRAAGQRLLWSFATAILPRRRAGDLNQSLMELGSEICQPRGPRCADCPVARWCEARRHSWQDQIPAAGRKLRYEDAHEIAVIVWRGNRILLRRCGPQERWAGLWDFPRVARPPSATGATERLGDQVRQLTGIQVHLEEKVTTLKHAVTRFRITLDCYRASFQSGAFKDSDQCQWVDPGALADYPLSVTGRKLSRWLTPRDREPGGR